MTCPSWCVGDIGSDHWAAPGSKTWPKIRSSGWPASPYDVTAAPTWGEADGLMPAVLLWTERVGDESRSESIDLTPDEARQLAAQLLAAADAVTA